MATRVILLKKVGRRKPGYGIEVDDFTAKLWASQGIAQIGNSATPLKKGNLQNYEGCTPVSPGVAAKIAEAKQISKTNKQTDINK